MKRVEVRADASLYAYEKILFLVLFSTYSVDAIQNCEIFDVLLKKFFLSFSKHSLKSVIV